MLMNNSLLVYLGASDWRHSEWVGEFYPDDMPEDWRLAYYQTQYGCVWLARAAWLDLPTDVWHTLLDDVRNEFRFLLEGSGDEIYLKHPILRTDARVIADEDARIIRFDMHTSLETLTSRLQDAHESDAVFLISRDSRLEKLREVATLLELLGM